MRISIHQLPGITSLALAVLLVAPGPLAGAPKKMAMPDFTKGDAIPAGADHDWNLGATGIRGWMYSDRLVTTDARQVRITKVDKNSPADGVLAVGDVILGVGGKPFSHDPRTEMGKALTTAESEAGGGNLSLIRWRNGKTETVVVKLPVLGAYGAAAPYNCPKSKRILDRGCKALASRVAAPSYRQNPIARCLNALALLASGNPEYLPLVKKEAQWAAGFSADGFQTWYYGYVIMLLSEYAMETGDQSVMPGLRRLALEAANGQSIVGSWGHRFAGPDGRLMGYGMMNAPGLPLTTSLVMARQAGVKDPAVALAIERSVRLLRFYVGKGSVPYGDHAPWIQTHEDNGKNGMAAVLFNLLGEAEAAEYFSRMSVASHGAERDSGHTGNFFNVLWSLPGVAQSGPNATGAWMKEFGAWYFDLARRWDGTFPHQGPPQMTGDKYGNWDCTGAYLLAYAMPLKKLCLTGKRESSVPQLDVAAAQSLIDDGRGWSNKDRNSAYDKLSSEQLVARLSSWSPVVRERAGMALARREGAPVAVLVKMLDAPRLETRYGACQVLAMLKGGAAPAVPALRRSLEHEDMWLRIKAAEALANIGGPAMSAVPELLTMLAKGPSKSDPRGMEQRFLSFAVFGNMLKNSLEGVDRGLLRDAVLAGLQNQDGRSRGTVGRMYQQLTYEEIKPLLPAIHEAIVVPAPSGIMFASGVRLQGIAILAKHRIKEGMPLCIQVMEIDKWGKKSRIAQCLKTLGTYGAAAKPMLPRLRQLEKDLLAHKEARMLETVIGQVRALIKEIESSTATVELRSMNLLAGVCAAPASRGRAGTSGTKQSVKQLQADFRKLKFGMFLHYNMATYKGVQWVEGYPDASTFNPGGNVDTDAWADAAKAAGMKYGVLTAKHVAGFCLWGSKYTTYDVMHPDCPYKKDLVAQFIESFTSRGLKAGLYYCWRHPGFDKGKNKGKFKVLPPECDPAEHSLKEQIEFQKKQITELLTKYPDVFYIWNDALDPVIMSAEEARKFLKGVRPDVLASSNWWDWGKKGTPFVDIAVKEMRPFPETNRAPGETCWKLEQGWFWNEGARSKTAEQVVGTMATAHSRNSNFLLNVGPDRNGNIVESSIKTLAEIGRLRAPDATADLPK